MANRQARREQRRGARRAASQNRSPGRPPGGPRRGSSLPEWLTQPFTLIVGGLAIVAAVVIGVVVALGGSGGTDEAFADALRQHEIPADMADGTKLGSDDAPIKLQVWEDYQCPFCLRYNAEDEPGIIEDYVIPGLVQLEFRHMPILGTESTTAALGAECAADQNLFWEFNREAFLRQAEAGQGTNEEIDVGRLDDSSLKDVASDVGIDRSIFDTCLETSQHLEKVQEDQALGTQFGISGTPGFVINGSPIGGGAPTDWNGFLDDVLEQIEGGADGEETPADGDGTPDEGDDAEPTATAAE